MSSLVSGPLRALWVVKRHTQAWMHRVRRRTSRSRSSSNKCPSCLGCSFARLSASLITFASLSEAWVFSVTGFSGQFSGSCSHAGPFHQSSGLVTCPPRLARSAGLSVVGTCLNPWMLFYLLNAVGNELSVQAISQNPVEGDGTVQPTVDSGLR